MDPNIAWSLLPDKVLLTVSKMLKKIDIVHASSTCTRWRRMFYEPRLWRTFTFKLKSSDKNHKAVQEKLQKHLQTIGSSVQHVTIICPGPKTIVVKRLVADWIKVILRTLAENNSCILSFKLENLRMDKHWQVFDFAKGELADTLCQFIESQTCLQNLDLSEALLPTTFGHMVMSSLARSPSVDTLQQLDIFYLYAFCLEYNIKHIEHIRSKLFKCTQLQEITINYSLLKVLEVQKLCEHFQHSLEKLQLKTKSALQEEIVTNYFRQDDQYEVYTYGDDDDYKDYNDGIGAHIGYDDDDDKSAIASHNWQEALQFCPGLIVSVEMDLVDNQLDEILAPAMPVSHLTIKGLRREDWGDEGGEVGINEVLRRLSRFSLRSLKTATFIAHTVERPEITPWIEVCRPEVIKFLRTYPTLTIITISRTLVSFGLLESVSTELRPRFRLNRDIESLFSPYTTMSSFR